MKRAIEIQGKQYPVKFGYGVLKELGLHWGCKGINTTFKEVQGVFDETEGIPFEKEEKFVDLFRFGAAKADPDTDIDTVDPEVIIEAVVFNPVNMEIFMEKFQEMMNKNSGNPQPHREVRKKAAPKKK